MSCCRFNLFLSLIHFFAFAHFFQSFLPSLRRDGGTARDDHHPRCDLLLRSLCFDQIRRGFCGCTFNSFMIPLHFFIFVQAVVHVELDMIVVEHDEIFVFVHCAEYRTSTMPSTNFICPSPHCHSSCFPCTFFRLLLFSLQHYHNLLLLLLRSPSLLVFSHLHFLFALLLFLWLRFFFLIFSVISWCLFSSSGFSTSMFFPA